MSTLLPLARADHNNIQASPCDGGNCGMPLGVIVPYEMDDGTLTDQPRFILHPSFRDDIAGEGYYEYPHNPGITLNFIYSPANRVDMIPDKTLNSNIITRAPRPWDDVVITEIWVGGRNQLSTIAEMFRTFHEYWLTAPPLTEHIGWCPRDITTDRYLVDIVDVQLGGIDYNYREVRKYTTGNNVTDVYLDQQLTLKLKLVAPWTDQI